MKNDSSCILNRKIWNTICKKCFARCDGELDGWILKILTCQGLNLPDKKSEEGKIVKKIEFYTFFNQNTHIISMVKSLAGNVRMWSGNALDWNAILVCA